ncbi:hypothetical protein EX895_000714 [Sporisorium graminicola]|uniref:tRNA-splicing endonuclease subunit Sen34 n=1 Tax=Sporisorium graminicola TaxID=280036 RepID=A0A4U7L1T3_9BASI|nr:hypothetical protein EX895_000714 [Sporisorium graminicola]TKY90716.1 hypothetical protein EX895_000714 [Sporisorium graminicola]
MSSSSSPPTATMLASSAITHLSATYPNRVQIHLHPATSLPASLASSLSDAVDSPAPRGDLPVALVWTVESLRLMRTYGVTGSYTGTLAQFPQQNVFLGLPVQMLPEEVVFLVRRGRAVVVDECASYRASGAGERAEVRNAVAEDRRGQQLAAWHERQLLRAKHSSSSAGSAQPTQAELDTLPWHYTIPTTSSALPWYTPTAYTHLSAIQHVFAYPRTAREIGSTALFDHLRGDHGLWCLNGLRFGGSFAVYPGDPLRYHSHYTAQLVLRGEDIAMTSLVANGRLGTAVKKTHLLCCVQDVAEGLEAQDEAEIGAQIGSGRFDVAVRGNRDPTRSQAAQEGDGDGEAIAGTTLATFNVFSLAWAGFGT